LQYKFELSRSAVTVGVGDCVCGATGNSKTGDMFGEVGVHIGIGDRTIVADI
jgi:hypothetical protein